MSVGRRFRGIALAGIAFQAGAAAVDSATIMSALVFRLTGSPLLVGAVPAILRFGWLSPQLIVGFLAQRSGSSMRFYMIGAFGRAACMAALAGVLWFGVGWPVPVLAGAVMALWTAYAFVSGIVAVPYNDIVARSVPSRLRSRLLAVRFFGGGLLALAVAALADRLLAGLEFPRAFAAIIAMAAVLMVLSAVVFTATGEPAGSRDRARATGFFAYLREGVRVFRTDRDFARFVQAQWFGGAVLMAMPFYVVQAGALGVPPERVAALLGAQTAGALLSNPLWGWWGDRRGKAGLLRAIALGRALPPLAVLALGAAAPDAALPVVQSAAPDAAPDAAGGGWIFAAFAALFFVNGALANGLTIAVIGLLMEISPDHRRPAWSGYFNAITAPAYLLPLGAGALAGVAGTGIVFALSLVAALMQFGLLARIGQGG